jgi:hypothetical protein
VARWEDAQFKTCFENFPTNIVVSIIDFAENYSFEIQNKVQSMLWHSYQVTILMHICWMQNPNPYPHDPDFQTLMKYHFHILDDKSHVSVFV